MPVILVPRNISLRDKELGRNPYMDLISYAPERIALRDAGNFYKKFEFVEHRINVLIQKYIKLMNGKTRNEYEIKRIVKQLDFLTSLKSQSSKIFVIRINSFLDIFCNRVKQIIDGKRPNSKWRGMSLDKKVNELVPIMDKKTQDVYDSFIIYKDFFRNKTTHSDLLGEMIEFIPMNWNEFDEIWKTYRKISILIWGYSFAGTYPDYLNPMISPGNPFMLEELNMLPEARFYTSYVAEYYGRNTLNEILKEFNLKVVPIDSKKNER